MTLWLDMDGVLADLRRGYEAKFGGDASTEADSIDWELVRGDPRFWIELPPMPDLDELWGAVRHAEPAILTGCPAVGAEHAAHSKRAWIDRHLGLHVRAAFCRSSRKFEFCRPGDVLVDDWEKYRHLWVAAGGRWVTHRTAADTVRELRRIGAL